MYLQEYKIGVVDETLQVIHREKTWKISIQAKANTGQTNHVGPSSRGYGVCYNYRKSVHYDNTYTCPKVYKYHEATNNNDNNDKKMKNKLECC